MGASSLRSNKEKLHFSYNVFTLDNVVVPLTHEQVFLMKVGSYMLSCRAKELSLIAIIFMAATIIMWTCDRSPLSFLIISGADIKRVPLEPKRHVREDISMLTQRKVIHNEDEDHLDKTLSIDTAKSSSDFETIQIQKKVNHTPIPMSECVLDASTLGKMISTAGKDSSDVLDVGNEYGLVLPPGSIRPNGWAYRFLSTNTTVLYYWSSGLCELEPLDVKDPQTKYSMHLDRPPSFLHQFLHKIDVLVLNTGHHWNRGKLRANRWVMYVGGAPNTNKKIANMGRDKNFIIHNTVKWLDSQLPKHPHLKAFYRSISPRHFVNGDWNIEGSCNNTKPMSIGKEVLQEGSSDHAAVSVVRWTGVKLLDITALSQVRDEGHISRISITSSRRVQDCLHWCSPGVPDTWNEILFAQI
ncbi:protein trichome birefringence-like 16 isoform X2 [Gossypium australe]|uniref:Protein trichome birefringence-like 16 isoform X2 n=1 Tax=Gossypium australe TaxID=47621 RepID=A0A5B6W6M2_9ROSI|nr:protein trichome birefringence-like 16 isoform X2 [Gossypium australe]